MKIDGKTILTSLIGFIIIISIVGAGIPKLNFALGNFSRGAGQTVDNATAGTYKSLGLPFVSFFASNGIVTLIIMAGILVGIVYYFETKK
jgi:hypothetical protein